MRLLPHILWVWEVDIAGFTAPLACTLISLPLKRSWRCFRLWSRKRGSQRGGRSNTLHKAKKLGSTARLHKRARTTPPCGLQSNGFTAPYSVGLGGWYCWLHCTARLHPHQPAAEALLALLPPLEPQAREPARWQEQHLAQGQEVGKHSATAQACHNYPKLVHAVSCHSDHDLARLLPHILWVWGIDIAGCTAPACTLISLPLKRSWRCFRLGSCKRRSQRGGRSNTCTRPRCWKTRTAEQARPRCSPELVVRCDHQRNVTTSSCPKAYSLRIDRPLPAFIVRLPPKGFCRFRGRKNRGSACSNTCAKGPVVYSRLQVKWMMNSTWKSIIVS